MLVLTHVHKALESEWERQQSDEHVLTNQLKRLQDDLRRVNRQLEKQQTEKDTLEEKIGMAILMDMFLIPVLLTSLNDEECITTRYFYSVSLVHMQTRSTCT